ncbi:MAG: Ig-like domain-containing protein [Actinomycetota bacterium]|nr:Ig-like domain-containing protein [Actinomycetota bacterium]
MTPRSPQAVHYYLGAPGDYGNRDGLNDGKVDLIVPIPTHRSEIQIVSGNKQSVNPGQRLGQAVVLQYVDALSSGTIEGIPIDLTFVSASGQPIPPSGQPARFDDSGGATERVVTDEAGQARFDLTSLESRVPGQFAVQASVADDRAHLIKSSQVTVYNTQFTTDVALTSSADDNTSTDGEPVTFTAALTTPENGGGPVDSGSVQFTVDGTPLGTPVSVQSGFAESETISTLAPGPHHVLATYTDVVKGAQASAFASLGQTVAADAATSVSITTSNPDAVDGESGRFTATVTPEKDLGVPTGTVQFTLDGTDLGEPVALEGDATADSASTALHIPTGSIGGRQPFEVTAIYSGDANYVSSTGTLTQYVKWDTTLDIWSSEPEGVYTDTSVTFTGTVEGTWYPDLYPKHTGTLQAFLGDEPLTDPFPINDKSATTPPIKASTLGIGIHEITLRYSGDENYGPATSDTFYQIVLDFADRPPGATPPPVPAQPGSNPSTGGPHSGLAMSGTDTASVMLLTGILLTVGGVLYSAGAIRRRGRSHGMR